MKGEKIGIVGKNGSGKSTFLNLVVFVRPSYLYGDLSELIYFQNRQSYATYQQYENATIIICTLFFLGLLIISYSEIY